MNGMRIFRITYEEICTDYKQNPALNTKISCQKEISEHEICSLYPNDREVINKLKQDLLKEIQSQM